jgi:SNF2 family DNA or RNA helicase
MKLHKYQERAKHHILNNTHSGLFLEMGLGKTVISLSAINTLMYEELEINKVLIIAPKRVAESVWDAEIKKWPHLRHLTVSKITGTVKERRKAVIKKADIYTIGRDNISWLCGLFGGSSLPFDMLIIDELSSFKNPSSIRFKSLRLVQPCFKRVIGLTGTPAPNGLIDLWSQLYLLDRGERLGKTVTAYRQMYFKPGMSIGPVVYNYKPLSDSEQGIKEKIKDICISMKSEDYLDLPKTVYNTIKIDLGEEVLARYEQFEQDLVMELLENDTEITVVNAAALSIKLLQMSNGAVYDEEKNYHEIHDKKLEALKEIVDTSTDNVLIAWSFRHDMERIHKYLSKYKPVKLETEQHIKDWNAGKIKVMTMHPASGGHGLNLQKGGATVIWFGQTWSLELYQQLNARLNRQGQEKSVIIHHLVSAGTIDERVVKTTSNKMIVQDGLMNAVKAIIKKYKKNF